MYLQTRAMPLLFLRLESKEENNRVNKSNNSKKIEKTIEIAMK